MKLYDFDGMFDEKMSQYIKSNKKNLSESEWEDAIPTLYKRFGDTVIKSLGKTPNQFYSEMDGKQLIKTLRAHIKQGISVSEYLNNAIERMDDRVRLLLPLLSGSENEIIYAVSILGAEKSAIPDYMRILLSTENETIKNACVEHVKMLADVAKEEALKLYFEGKEVELMLEILSNCTVPDDRIYDILVKEFRRATDDVLMYIGFLATYGDERALDVFTDKIEGDINYVEFLELKFAIETLGGSYEKPRDFSEDINYQIIQTKSEKLTDKDEQN